MSTTARFQGAQGMREQTSLIARSPLVLENHLDGSGPLLPVDLSAHIKQRKQARDIRLLPKCPNTLRHDLKEVGPLAYRRGSLADWCALCVKSDSIR